MKLRIARAGLAALLGSTLALAAWAQGASSSFTCTGLSGTPFRVVVNDRTKTVAAPDNVQNAGPVTSFGSDKVIWGDPAHVYTLDRQKPGLHLDYANRQGTGRSAYDFKCSKD